MTLTSFFTFVNDTLHPHNSLFSVHANGLVVRNLPSAPLPYSHYNKKMYEMVILKLKLCVKVIFLVFI